MRFFETIRIEDGKPKHLDYHNRRLNTTIAHHFPPQPPIDLANFLVDPPSQGLFRAKVVYTNRIEGVEYSPYTPATITTLALVEASIDYPYKYLDRSPIEEFFAKRGEADEIIIVKDGLLTDTSRANIALFDGIKWLTPARPLLPGTTRARLIDAGVLHEADIPVHEIENYQGFALLNAMVGFYELKQWKIVEPIG
ncbi:MAG: hypothetical protein C6I00_06925 [Nitratiruptor sp.]|nr:hypothetical protein [Nitratiruptor sp.]NPA83770.1 hypothetical protein [Campylobacterota bacterium]